MKGSGFYGKGNQVKGIVKGGNEPAVKSTDYLKVTPNETVASDSAKEEYNKDGAPLLGGIIKKVAGVASKVKNTVKNVKDKVSSFTDNIPGFKN